MVLGFCCSIRYHRNTSWYRIRARWEYRHLYWREPKSFSERLRDNLLKKSALGSNRKVCSIAKNNSTDLGLLKKMQSHNINIRPQTSYTKWTHASLPNRLHLPPEETRRLAPALSTELCGDTLRDQQGHDVSALLCLTTHSHLFPISRSKHQVDGVWCETLFLIDCWRSCSICWAQRASTIYKTVND